MTLFWFRNDLRLSDNPALHAAAQGSGPLMPLFILDEAAAGPYALGRASRSWLQQSLQALASSLGGKLSCYVGQAPQLLATLCRRHKVKALFFNRCYSWWGRRQQDAVATLLAQQGVRLHCYDAALLWSPEQVSKADGSPYRVFTPFYQRGCLQASPPRKPLPAPQLAGRLVCDPQRLSVQRLGLDTGGLWQQRYGSHWQAGEQAAQQQLTRFFSQGLSGYQQGRDLLSRPHLSRLSPALRWGECSPHQLWHAATPAQPDLSAFRRQLAWREFSYHLLWHHPTLPQQPFQPRFAHFPWRHEQALVQAWQQGRTGYPLVDAGMAELLQTGYMHNRVRMVAASLLVKNLLQHWHHGRDWFWQQLLDADLANNSASWQWVAGCGADAAPYFRIFNPVLQAQRFDAQGSYIRRWLPQLAQLPTPYLFKPWQAPAPLLAKAGIVLGKHYPKRLVGLDSSRQQALHAYRQLPAAHP